MTTAMRLDHQHELARRVRNFLHQQTHPDVDRLLVQASADVVVVRGVVASDAARRLASDCCLRVAGVRRVINETVVAGA